MPPSFCAGSVLLLSASPLLPAKDWLIISEFGAKSQEGWRVFEKCWECGRLARLWLGHPCPSVLFTGKMPVLHCVAWASLPKLFFNECAGETPALPADPFCLAPVSCRALWGHQQDTDATRVHGQDAPATIFRTPPVLVSAFVLKKPNFSLGQRCPSHTMGQEDSAFNSRLYSSRRGLALWVLPCASSSSANPCRVAKWALNIWRSRSGLYNPKLRPALLNG